MNVYFYVAFAQQVAPLRVTGNLKKFFGKNGYGTQITWVGSILTKIPRKLFKQLRCQANKLECLSLETKTFSGKNWTL